MGAKTTSSRGGSRVNQTKRAIRTVAIVDQAGTVEQRTNIRNGRYTVHFMVAEKWTCNALKTISVMIG